LLAQSNRAGADFRSLIQWQAAKQESMKFYQLTITYPEGDALQLHQALLLLKSSRCLNASAF
jgi:hypothetical protein